MNENEMMTEYTRLTEADVGAIMKQAEDNALPFIFSAEFGELGEGVGLVAVEEAEDVPGAYFAGYWAESWRKAEAFRAAVYGAAWALGHFAEPSTAWEDEITSEDGARRYVSVFVAAADYMGDDGKARRKQDANKQRGGAE